MVEFFTSKFGYDMEWVGLKVLGQVFFTHKDNTLKERDRTFAQFAMEVPIP